jgi:hypothetical protein
MSKAHIIFLVLAIVFAWPLPLSLDFTMSVIPGWHTTILPYYLESQIVFFAWLCLLSAAYWLLKKTNTTVSKAVFVAHFLLTIPALILVKFPFVMLIPEEPILVLALPTVFIIGQLLFGWYLVKNIRTKLL